MKLKFVYTIPHFHNPGGCTMPVEKRRRLVELAEKYDFLIVEDDPYRDIVFDGASLPSMLSMDESGRACRVHELLHQAGLPGPAHRLRGRSGRR